MHARLINNENLLGLPCENPELRENRLFNAVFAFESLRALIANTEFATGNGKKMVDLAIALECPIHFGRSKELFVAFTQTDEYKKDKEELIRRVNEWFLYSTTGSKEVQQPAASGAMNEGQPKGKGKKRERLTFVEYDTPIPKDKMIFGRNQESLSKKLGTTPDTMIRRARETKGILHFWKRNWWVYETDKDCFGRKTKKRQEMN
jgi:hypothetical protein